MGSCTYVFAPKDGRESDIKTLVSVSHAAAVMAAEAAVLRRVSAWRFTV